MTTENSGTGIIASYQISEGWERQGWGLVAALLGVSALLSIVLLTRDVGLLRIAGVLVLVLSLAACYPLLAVWICQLDVTATELRWRSLARRSVIPLDDLVRVRRDPRNR